MSVLEEGGTLSAHTTVILPPGSVPICAVLENPGLWDKFKRAEKLWPPSVERVKKMSKFPGLSFSHTTLILPARSTAISALLEFPTLCERLLGAEKLAP